MRVALEPFDDHQIDRAELLQNIAKRRLGLVTQFVDHRPAPARDDRDLAGAGLPVQPGILARLVDVEFVVRVLDGRDLQPAPHQHRDHAVTSVVLPEPLQPARPMMRMSVLYGSFARRFHAQRADAGAGRLVAQRFQECLHRRPIAAVFAQQKIVFLRRDRQE